MGVAPTVGREWPGFSRISNFNVANVGFLVAGAVLMHLLMLTIKEKNLEKKSQDICSLMVFQPFLSGL